MTNLHRMASVLAAGLLLVGAGCAKPPADEPAAPVAAPVEVSAQAKEAMAGDRAKANEEAERDSLNMTVAMILTEGADAPSNVTLGDIIGCNDRIAYLSVHRARQTADTLGDALATLFSIKTANVDGVYNALRQSDLTVDTIRSMDGVTTEVRLKGVTKSAGACDDPRIKAQVEHTVARFRPKYKIFLNGSEADWRCMGDQSGDCK